GGKGVGRLHLPDARPAYMAWETVPGVNWSVGVATAAAPLDRQRHIAIATALGSTLLSLGSGLLLAMLVARRVTRPLRQLAKGEAIEQVHFSEVREIAWLQDALQQAAQQRDITARRRAEEALRQAERRLRESQHMVELAQEAGHVGFFDYRFESDTMSWTSGMSRLLGRAPYSFEGHWEDWMAHMGAVDQALVRESIQHAVEAALDQTMFQFATLRDMQERRWLSARVVLKYDARQQPIHLIGVVMDITQQVLAEQERSSYFQREQAARLDAEQANRAKDEFLAMLGHELRNPLGAIAAACEVLDRVDAHAEPSRKARLIISRQTRHLARLMDDR